MERFELAALIIDTEDTMGLATDFVAPALMLQPPVQQIELAYR